MWILPPNDYLYLHTRLNTNKFLSKSTPLHMYLYLSLRYTHQHTKWISTLSHCTKYPSGLNIYTLPAHILSHVWLSVTPWTVARQPSLFMELSREEYWSGLPFPTPGGLPNPGIEPISLVSSAMPGRFFTTILPGKHIHNLTNNK